MPSAVADTDLVARQPGEAPTHVARSAMLSLLLAASTLCSAIPATLTAQATTRPGTSQQEAKRVHDARSTRDSVIARRAAWASGAHLALGASGRRVRLRYGIDWFGTPATPSVHARPAAFAGMSDDVLDGMKDVRDRVVVVMMSTGNVESMMESALRVRDAAEAAHAAGVLFLLSPTFDEAEVREAATEIESATDEVLPFAAPTEELPTMFVRYGAFVGAARLLGIDVTQLTLRVVGGGTTENAPAVTIESELPAAPLTIAPRMRTEGTGFDYAGAHQN